MTLAELADAWQDMAPHVATLTRHASEATTVVEWGVRGAVSTWAILDGLPSDGRLYSVDIDPAVADAPDRVRWDSRWTLLIGDDLSPHVQAQLPDHADLVFIDTSHTYEQTVGELAYALTLTPSRIVLHDYVMPSVTKAVDEFCAREEWVLVDNELPYGLATLEPR